MVSNVVIARMSEVDRQPAGRSVTARSGIVATDGRGVLAAGDGTAVRSTARRMLSLLASGSSPVPRRRGRLAYWLEDDLIRADAEELAQFAHLGHLGHPPPALPEVDRLRLDADPQRQFELGPTLFLAKRSDRLHHVPYLTELDYNRITLPV
jgi:hypothetical protein